jgi:hypothetical protein
VIGAEGAVTFEVESWLRKEGGPKANQFTLIWRKWQKDELQSWSREYRRRKDGGLSVEATSA